MNEKKIERIVTGTIDDGVDVLDKFQEEYAKIKERELLFHRIIYLNGMTFVCGVQGTGKTYLVKSILQNPSVKKDLNNTFWIDVPNDIVFICKWLEYKKVCFEGLQLLMQNKLKGEYYSKWDELTERTHMTVNKERFDFLPFDPIKYDMIIIDDVARFPDLRIILHYCTILRHIHVGIIFISQTEGLLPKAFRDLVSIFITFNVPETKMLSNPHIRREVHNLVINKRDKYEAIMVNLVENKISVISAHEINEKTPEEKIEEKEKPKKKEDSEVTSFKSELNALDV